MKTSTLECKENEQILKISHQKNANEQKLLLTSKIRKQKKTIKNNRLGEGSGWEASTDRRGNAKTCLVLECYILVLLSPPPTHTLESEEMKNNTLECNKNDEMPENPDVKNVNKKKNHLTPVKLQSKKHDKKTLVPQVGSDQDASNEHRERVISRLLCILLLSYY